MRFLHTACVVALWLLFALAVSPQNRKIKVYSVRTDDRTEIAQISEMLYTLDLPTWTPSIVSSDVVVVVMPDKLERFLQALKDINPELNMKVLHEDLMRSILKEARGMRETYRGPAGDLIDDAWFKSFHLYADHVKFLEHLAKHFPNNARLVKIGTTHEGRDITGINIYGSSGPETRPAIIFQSGLHAREWITITVAEHTAYSLLTNYTNKSPEIMSYVENYDIYIFPILNPDGFNYSTIEFDPKKEDDYSNLNYRLWRKNRQPTVNGTCLGWDLNRNWPYQWDVVDSKSAKDPCYEAYRGDSEGGSLEVKAMIDFMNARARSEVGAKLYVDWHSFGGFFMSPYAYTCAKATTNAAKYEHLSLGFATAFKAQFGTNMTGIRICNRYPDIGGSGVDYANDVLKVPFAFAVEMPSNSFLGFIVPQSDILPSGIEAYAGVRSLLRDLELVDLPSPFPPIEEMPLPPKDDDLKERSHKGSSGPVVDRGHSEL